MAGYNWSPSKYIFSSDDRQILVPSGSTVRVYSVVDGSFVHALPFEEDNSLILHGDNIVSVQLHPSFPDKYVLCFTNNRKLVVISLENGQVVYHEDLFQKINLPPEQLGQGMDFGHCLLMPSKKKKRIELYYGVMAHFRFYQKELPFPFAKNKTQPKSFHLVFKENMKSERIHQFAAVALSPAGKFVAMINGRFLYLQSLPIENSKGVKHMQKENEFTCITSHPTEEIIATGDSIGCVIIWRHIFHSLPHKSFYHWHPSPVTSMSFSSIGSKLYSACDQGKLISWQMDSPGMHSSLGNLNVPIRGVIADSCNKLIALSLMDGTIKLLASTSTIKNTVVTLLENSVSQMDINLNLSEANYDPTSKCVLIKGFNGTLQFFSLSSNSVKQVLDVTETNYYQNYGDGPKAIPIILNNVAISLDGQWLATDELRDDSEYLMFERLRFWTKKNDTFGIVNLVDLPHEKQISGMKFSYDASIFVTISSDCYFKVWKRVSNATQGDSAFVLWQSGNRSLGIVPSSLSISCDSSIVAVQFDNHITFWDVTQKSLDLLEGLDEVNENWEDAVVGFDFAAGSLINLFCHVRRNSIGTFDFLTSKQNWLVKSKPDVTNCAFAFNHSSNRMAVLNSEKFITIYNVDSSVPLGVISNELTSIIGDVKSLLAVDLSAFMESQHQTTCQAPSGILCVNNRKQLISFLPRDFAVKKGRCRTKSDSESGEGTFKIVGKLMSDAYVLPVERNVSSIKRKVEMEFDSDQLVNHMFVKDATHLMPSLNALCNQFLKSLFLRELPSSNEKKSKRGTV